MDWVIQHRIWFLALGWATVIIFLILGIISFVTAGNQQENKKSFVLSNGLHRFFLGLMMSALNPVQIPFWFLWTTTLFQMGLLPSSAVAFNLFTVGAGIGTLGGLAVYIHGGNWLVNKFKTSNSKLNRIMGIIFILTALLQLWKMLFDPFI